METGIWTFQTATGSVRLLLSGEEESVRSLHEELRAAAAVADDVNEFVALAAKLAIQHRVTIGDVIRSTPVGRHEVDLRAEIRRAAHIDDVEIALDIVKAALREAEPADRERLAVDPGWTDERVYVRELVETFDERAD